MKPIVLTTAIAAALLLAACANEPAPTAATPAAEAPADAASQTEAVYGDEAPVAIQADAHHDDGHAHNADGSHPTGEDHAEGGEEGGDGDHAHGDDADHSH